MNVDHYFTIGSAHQAQGRPCEDYALSGVLPSGVHFGAVADGCSGAYAHTDIGARSLVWAFRSVLAQRQFSTSAWFTPEFQVALQQAFEATRYEGLVQDDYLATLVGFAATPEQASVYVHGDGAVALRYADGRHVLVEFHWLDNTPFYLAYRDGSGAMACFLNGHQSSEIAPLTKRTTVFRVSPSGIETLDQQTVQLTVADVIDGCVLNFAPRAQGVVALAVLTDGIEQVGSESSLAMTAEFLAFKNHQGDFVKRRMIRALKTLRQAGAAPVDDVGIAAVWFDPGDL